MPTWTQCLQTMVLLAIAGFGLVIVSSHWLLLALLMAAVAIAAAILWLRR